MAERAQESGEELNILVNLSGRGDKDMDLVMRLLGDLAFQDPKEYPVTDQEICVRDVVEQMTAESNEREGIQR